MKVDKDDQVPMRHNTGTKSIMFDGTVPSRVPRGFKHYQVAVTRQPPEYLFQVSGLLLSMILPLMTPAYLQSRVSCDAAIFATDIGRILCSP